MDLSKLNREQRIAAETIEGPLLILAGAGSGKTRALTYRVANLIDHGVPAWRILALTFTNKAAKEMKNRVADLIGPEAADEAWISTFHSTCARILRRDIEKIGYSRSFVIYDDDDQTRVIKEILKHENIDENYLPIREIRGKISDAKNKLLSPDEWFQKSARDRRCGMIHDVMCGYEKRMKTLNALDFDDLLLKTLELLADHPPVLQYYQDRFRYVLVDEYQDTNKAQYEMIRMITAESRNLCVVGDDDQSIYGWRGADIRNILDFEDDYPDAKVIKLEQNYRSTATILDAANQLIANNEGRKDKKLWTEHGDGEKIELYRASDEHDESMWIAKQIRDLSKAGNSFGDCAILYRTNAQSRVPEEMLMRSNIPYKVFGGQKFYERKEIKDILAYLRVIVNPADDISLSRIINVPKRAIGDTTVQALAEAAAEREVPLYGVLNDPPETLGTRAKTSVSNFFAMMTLLGAMKEAMGLTEFVDTLIEKTGLEEQYQKENTDEARDRIENMNEFRNGIREYAESEEEPTLEGYLENVSLVTDLDRETDAGRGWVTMMTLHSAKGLEFDNVFIPGMEENLFPSSRSVDDGNRLEEERRLMYVGITRARKRLFLSYASERMLYNQYNHNPPSRFLREIPARLMHNHAGEERDGYAFSARSVGVGAGVGGFGGTRSAGAGTGGFAGPRSTGNTGYGRNVVPFTRPAGARNRLPVKPGTVGEPVLTIKGKSLGEIPGVSKGFGTVASTARALEDTAMKALFAPGDRVRHPKFGAGTVTKITGSGKNATITVRFDRDKERMLSLAVAPIVRIESD